MSGGGIKQSQNTLQGVAGQQQGTASLLGAEGQAFLKQGQAEQQPLVDFLHKIIGGDSVSTNQALAPALANITGQTVTNRENIYDQSAPGAGRDVLLGENQRSQGQQVAGLTNQAFLSAFPELAQLGQGNINTSLGLTGGGITSLANSATTTTNVLNEQQQQKASTLNFFGQLAQAAGQGAGLAAACWIAEAIYGVDDMRTFVLRRYLNGPFCQHLSGRLVMALYRAVGRQVAWLARRSALLRGAFRPLFERALINATAWDATLRRQ